MARPGNLPAPPATPTPMRAAWLLALLLLAAGVITWITHLTQERIAQNEAALMESALHAVLPAGSFDNEPHLDRILMRDAQLLGSDAPTPVYRARLGGKPAAAVITAVARQGYVGPITLLVAIAPGGTILGVRVIAHQETPGLGDRIDPQRSDWSEIFTGRSLADPLPQGWATRRDGGTFDQLTGATITSRAVVSAVRDAASFFAGHESEIFLLPVE